MHLEEPGSEVWMVSRPDKPIVITASQSEESSEPSEFIVLQPFPYLRLCKRCTR